MKMFLVITAIFTMQLAHASIDDDGQYIYVCYGKVVDSQSVSRSFRYVTDLGFSIAAYADLYIPGLTNNFITLKRNAFVGLKLKSGMALGMQLMHDTGNGGAGAVPGAVVSIQDETLVLEYTSEANETLSAKCIKYNLR